MNFMQHLENFTTVEEGEAAIIAAEKLRDSMGGPIYYSACADDVEELKQKLFIMKLKANKDTPPDRSKESHEDAVKRYLDHPKDETTEERARRINRFRAGY